MFMQAVSVYETVKEIVGEDREDILVPLQHTLGNVLSMWYRSEISYGEFAPFAEAGNAALRDAGEYPRFAVGTETRGCLAGTTYLEIID